MPTDAGRKAARMAVQRELARRQGDGVSLGRAAGVHAQTVQAFLRGERWPSLKTLGRLDVALGWPAGTLSAIAEGGYPEGVPDVDDAAPDLIAPRDQTVSSGSDTGGQLLIMRPEGLTEDEWESIRRESEGYIEWLIEKAARERTQQG